MSASPETPQVGVVVLAAGKGTRLRSDRPKVLHEVCGRSLLGWVCDAAAELGAVRTAVVVGHRAEEVADEAARIAPPGLQVVHQAEQLGTGHAVQRAAADGALDGVERVVVLAGDTPAITGSTLRRLLDAARDGAAAMVTFEPDDPAGYGRVVRDPATGEVARIVEHADATDAELAVGEVNASIYCFDPDALRAHLDGLSRDTAQGEAYLTDVVAPLTGAGVAAVRAPAEECLGVNDQVELARAGAVLRRRLLEALMRDGVRVDDPSRTYVEVGCRVQRGARLRPGTHLEGATEVASGADVGPDCRLVDARVGEGARVHASTLVGCEVGADCDVGPYAHLRPGARLAPGVRAGSFVEIKDATVGEGSKVPHLSYVGTAEIGAGVNVGAGTITCNYDGRVKHRTVVGDGAFIGSDTMLVAPVRIGAGAATGASSAITRDVPDDALAVERGEQRIVEGWAARRRERGSDAPADG